MRWLKRKKIALPFVAAVAVYILACWAVCGHAGDKFPPSYKRLLNGIAGASLESQTTIMEQARGA
jgi:hypothetical protein